ncbi:MAG: HD domain-containing protein [Burkholderiales bacterium]|nr:HD domain-containing protein [Phycisphaerae bacterium]
MHILLVASDRTHAIRFEQQLVRCGHVVTLASRAFEALDVLRAQQVQMLITDPQLTDMDTPDFVRIARKMGLAQYVYIMVLTTSHEQNTINALLAAGADDCMRITVDEVELSLRVRNAERVVSIDTRDEAIIAMAKLAESRDSSTGRHVERVRLYARELAQAMWEMGHYFGQIDANFVELIYRSAALHDLGKVAIPDAILLKPGKLTAPERQVMERHTTIGADSLASVSNTRTRCGFLTMGREIALSHHERWNGTGYPQQRSGEDIPLAARIVAVADVYDALTSIRPYKGAVAHQDALKMIVDASGEHFDPLVVEALAACERTIDQIHVREADPVESERLLADAA